jgi:dTDP-4-dehydrorhamnose 3,5-epimerase
MEFRPLGLDGVIEITPKRSADHRGFFSETWSRERFRAAGLDHEWVQDNQSFSSASHVLRGIHFQVAPFAQDKLVRVLRGAIFDVAVDLRRESPRFGSWVSCLVSAERWNQVLVPRGFGHAFLTLEPATEVLYKVSAPYAPDCERSIRWDDPDLAIAWPLDGILPVLSEKDRLAPLLAAAGPLAF